MSAIFISHSSQDNAIAKQLEAQLASQGYESLFLDFEPEIGIIPGTSWERTLYRKLKACRAVIAVCTESYLSSHWCFAEVAIARMENKRIFGLKFPGAKSLPTILSEAQYVDMARPAGDAFAALLRGLDDARFKEHVEHSWNRNRAPYPGLFPFEESDAGVFFGRDSERHSALTLINSCQRHDLILLVGASGTGKSSFLRGSIVPELRRDGGWLPIGPFRPQSEPLENLAAAVAQLNPPDSWKEIAAELRRDGGLKRVVQDLQRTTGAQNSRVLLVIDQFEELLGQAEEHPEFLKILRDTLESDDNAISVLATIRSDFVQHLQQNVYTAGLQFEVFSIGSLSMPELRQAIEGPAALAEIEISAELMDRLLADARDARAVPLVAFTLRALWDNRGARDKLALPDYERIGGLAGAIAGFAEAAFAKATRRHADGEARLRAAFRQMARLTEDGAYTAAPLSPTDLDDVTRDMLSMFEQPGRLISTLDDGRLQVAREVLFSAWPRMAAWLDEDKSRLILERYIRRVAQQWMEAGRLVEELMRGSRARQAKEMLDLARISLNPVERDFVTKSWQLETEDEIMKSRLVNYYAVRDAAAKQFLGPAVTLLMTNLEQQAEEQDRAERRAGAGGWGFAEESRAERNALATLIGKGGKWHPLPPIRITNEKEEASGRGFHGDWWRFPCCRLDMLTGIREPSQLQPDGCEDVPDLSRVLSVTR
jgi:hypothetical protein